MADVSMRALLDSAQQAYDSGVPEGYEKVFDLKSIDHQGTGLNGDVFHGGRGNDVYQFGRYGGTDVVR